MIIVTAMGTGEIIDEVPRRDDKAVESAASATYSDKVVMPRLALRLEEVSVPGDIARQTWQQQEAILAHLQVAE